METVYLTGFYGVGKTMIGKAIASRKSLPYLDMNAISDPITQGMIVSINPLMVSDEENRHFIKRTGRVIYMRAKADTIMNNIEPYYKELPLFNNDFTVFSVEKQLNIYKPYFEELQNYVIDIDGKDLKELISEGLAIYNYINKVKSHIFV